MSTLKNKTQYRPDIDGLRAVAVSLVILYHLFPVVFRSGFLGVDIFFVISGFVVTQSLQSNLAGGYSRGLLLFYTRRMKRILPALYVNIIVALIFSCLFIPPSELRSLFKTAAAAVVGASNIALLYARFDYFSPDLSLNPFVHTWSLGVEEQFYLSLPLLLMGGLYLARRYKVNPILAFCASASFIYWIYLLSCAGVSAFYNPLARFWELLIGVMLFQHKSRLAPFASKAKGALQIAAVFSLVTALVLSSNLGLWSSANHVFAVLSACFVIVVGLSSSLLSRMISSQALVKVGLMSYSLYLWHYPVFALMSWNFDLNRFSPTLIAVVIFLATSFLSYRFIELPFRYAPFYGIKVIFTGIACGVLALLVVFSLYQLPSSRLYLGNAQQYGNLWPQDGSPLTPSLTTSQRDCHLQYRDKLSEDLFESCSTKDKKQNFIYLIGNSHAQHLVPMLEEVSNRLGYGYSALTISNCRLISAFQMVAGINYRYDLCKDYFDYVFDSIKKNSKEGDIVLIGARSLFEKPALSDEAKPSNIYIDSKEFSVKEVYDKSIADLSSFASLMQSRGVSIVLAGATPSFNLPATQCAPEWFRPERENCKTSRQSLLLEQTSYWETASEIMAKNKNVYFWDPSTDLCSDDYCYAFHDKKLTFRDQHHLSLFGSQLLAPGFIHFIGNKGLK